MAESTEFVFTREQVAELLVTEVCAQHSLQRADISHIEFVVYNNRVIVNGVEPPPAFQHARVVLMEKPKPKRRKRQRP